jgi:CRP/FNR family transcriptional regulator, cyclic AMP receptor protein
LVETIDALRQSKLLAGLGEDQLKGLAGMARQRSFAAGDVLITEGDARSAAMFVLVQGKVEVRVGGTVVAELGPGEVVGELALVVPAPRTADVVAKEDTLVVAVARWDFIPFVRSNPDVAMAVIEELAGRLEAANARIAKH